jgi:endo-1,4-beta-xylanase
MISRRQLLAAAPMAAMAACRGRTSADAAAVPFAPPPLRGLGAFGIGCCVQARWLPDPDYADLLARHFSQLTPEWEMKMEYILPRGASATDPRGWRWEGPDAIAAFAAAHGMRLHGHTLVWYAEHNPAFEALDGASGFEAAYRNYIAVVAGRYAQAASWDVLNEQVNENGIGLRDSLWSKNLGQDEHALIAFETAAKAAPKSVLFLNDYFLETMPRKRLEFMRMAERLLNKGAQIGGLGTQTHIHVDVEPGAITAAVKDLASLGLPIHISEMDISLGRKRLELRTVEERLQLQARLAGEAAEAFMALPEKQRFAFSVWGLRDKESWLRAPPNAGDGTDQPLLFDDQGQGKPAAEAIVRTLGRKA